MIYPNLKYRMRTEFLRLSFSDFEIVDGMNSPHHERLEAIKDENEKLKIKNEKSLIRDLKIRHS